MVTVGADDNDTITSVQWLKIVSCIQMVGFLESNELALALVFY